MGGNWHIWAEAQEITFVGLLILRTVWDRAHTADWKQRLMEMQKFKLGTSFLADQSTVYATYLHEITGENTHCLFDSPCKHRENMSGQRKISRCVR